MNKFGKRELLVFALLLGAITLALPDIAEGQIRLRPRPNPTRSPAADSSKSPKTSARDVKGSVAQLLNPQGLAYYNEHPTDLLALIRESVDHQRKFPDTAQNRSPWGVMHTTLAWGPEGEILIDDEPYNAINALCDNQRLKGVRLLAVKGGLPQPLEGPGLQGHPGQLLAILAQNNVPLEHPIRVGDQEFTVRDLVQYEQKTCKPSMELTFKLLGLSHYLPLNETWTAEDGGAWSVERLLRLELRQPINGQQTCGGTHRLMAIHLASAKRIREGGEITGAWLAAAKYTEDYHEYAFSLINPDGSCSTEWLERRAALDDPQRRVQTTGHVLEWLAVSLPDEKLRNEKVVGSFAYLAALLRVDIGETWAVGPRAHALRALRVYHDRLASQLPGPLESAGDRLAGEIALPGRSEESPNKLAESTPGTDPASGADPSSGTDTTGAPATSSPSAKRPGELPGTVTNTEPTSETVTTGTDTTERTTGQASTGGTVGTDTSVGAAGEGAAGTDTSDGANKTPEKTSGTDKGVGTDKSVESVGTDNSASEIGKNVGTVKSAAKSARTDRPKAAASRSANSVLESNGEERRERVASRPTDVATPSGRTKPANPKPAAKEPKPARPGAASSSKPTSPANGDTHNSTR
jgi:hypothetical protein